LAEVFWVSNAAAGGTRTSRAHHVPLNRVLEKLTPFEKRLLDQPPRITPPKATSGHDHSHVVVRINEEEINSNYPDAGYYHIVELTPQEARELLGIEEEAD
jgi:hypothetical protein